MVLDVYRAMECPEAEAGLFARFIQRLKAPAPSGFALCANGMQGLLMRVGGMRLCATAHDTPPGG